MLMSIEGHVFPGPSRFPLPLTLLIHENLGIVMTFLYSRKSLEEALTKNFTGGWEYLRKSVFAIPEERANKAIIELALFLRIVDDDEHLSKSTHKTADYGRLEMKDGSTKPLTFRDATNMIIHAAAFTWQFPDHDGPAVICESREREQWARAKLDIVAMAAVCGGLMS